MANVILLVVNQRRKLGTVSTIEMFFFFSVIDHAYTQLPVDGKEKEKYHLTW